MTRKNGPHLYTMRQAENANKAWKLRLDGWSMREIASEMGVSHVTIIKWLGDDLEELSGQNKKMAAFYRDLEGERLDQLYKKVVHELMSIVDDIIEEDTTDEEAGFMDAGCKLKAIETSAKLITQALQISTRRSKLWGLDAPVQTDQKVQFSVEKELDEALNRLESRLEPEAFQAVLEGIADIDDEE